MKPLSLLFCASTGVLIAPLTAAAQEIVGKAEPWQLGWQEAVTPSMVLVRDFHDHILLAICIIISLMVSALMGYICVRFRASANPNPSKTTHNTLLEVFWTAIPVMILIGIMFPSWQALRSQEIIPEADLTIKVVGHQWYWSYAYPDHGDIEFDSYMIKEEDLQPEQLRLLEVDNPIVVPVNKTVRVQLTAADVIHSWAMPAFGVKMDAIPGRLNETWFRAEKEGVYYGQCSELCGVLHGFMPIAVHVVSDQAFAAWIAEKGGSMPNPEEAEQANLSPASSLATPFQAAAAEADGSH